jgi:hypothetical protein
LISALAVPPMRAIALRLLRLLTCARCATERAAMSFAPGDGLFG